MVTQVSPKSQNNEKQQERGRTKGREIAKPRKPARKLAAKTLKQSKNTLNLERNLQTYTLT